MRLPPGGGAATGLALVVMAGLLECSLRARELPGEDFGRWQRALQHCRILSTPSGTGPPRQESCSVLRLDQQLEGLLTVRFLLPGGERPSLDRQLVFAGVLEEDSPGMRCRMSRCVPRWPLRLRVSAVGQTGYGATAAAMELTRAQLATGSCRLEAREVVCEAVGPAGERWRAEASP
ncbi:MAG: hypothetical protein ER33_08830 [Cyanobium sp. CACIAM 14]|nr:MAG: hypothetical protein ER33_08830 [Cyanobium sp. CACIAM 14]